MQFVRPIPFEEAIQKLGQRSPIAANLGSSEWADVPVALRERAFFSAHVESARFLQDTKSLLGDFLQSSVEDVVSPDGVPSTALKVGSRADFVKRAREFAVSEGLDVGIDPEKRGTIQDITARKRLELIYDVQTQAAWAYGDWKQGMDADVLDEFPAWRFIRDVKVKRPRPIHQQNEGVVRLKTDIGFWLAMNSREIGGFGVPWGPWGFNSGMGVEDVSRAEAEDLGLIGKDDVPTPVEKDLNDRLRASVSGLDSDTLGWLRDRLGNAAEVDMASGSVWWRGDETSRRLALGLPTPAGDRRRVPRRPRQPAAEVEPGEVVSPPTTPSPPHRLAPPVRAAFLLPSSGSIKRVLERSLNAIERVHGDGVLDAIPVRALPSGHPSFGQMRYRGSRVIDVRVKSSGRWPELTATHEIGHVLDMQALGNRGIFASHEGTGVLAQVMRAIRSSAAVRALEELAAGQTSRFVARRIREYLLTPHELWARAYAQWVTTRSGDPVLLAQLERKLGSHLHEQWSAADFEPIALAIDEAFRAKGWL